MTMERRVLVAVFLSFLVLYGYQTFFAPSEPPTSPATAAARPAPAVPPDDAPSASGGSPVPAPSGGSGTMAPEAPSEVAAIVSDAADRDIHVESDLVTAVFSNRGAVLKSWRLKRYLDDSGQPLELIPPMLAANQERPFTIDIGDPALDARLRKALYSVEGATTR